MNTYHKILTSKDIETFEKHFKVITFPKECTLIYEHHIPLSGVILVDGEIELRKKSTLIEKISQPVVLGVKQLLNQKALRIECFVKENSKLILLSRAEILSLNQLHPDLASCILD
jgi:signal-transduction protein with cAMP-binding, CBS, and nucleotidyltransferase domain